MVLPEVVFGGAVLFLTVWSRYRPKLRCAHTGVRRAGITVAPAVDGPLLMACFDGLDVVGRA